MRLFPTTKLEQTVRDYFAEYFSWMAFTLTVFNNKPVVLMRAYRNGRLVEYNFQLDKWQVLFDEGIEYHTLENIMGQFKREEETILLEHQKAAN